MKELLDKSNINQGKLKDYIIRLSTETIGKMSEPCYFPPWKRDYYEILNLIQLQETDIKSFFKTFFKNTPYAAGLILQDIGNCILIFCMWYFLSKRDHLGFGATILYYGLRQYSNICQGKFFRKYCKPDVWKYTLDNIAKTHLFIRERSIANAIYYLSKEMINSYTDDVMSADPNRIFKFVYEYRSRITQSLRSFAEAYYEFEKQGLGYKQSIEKQDTEEGEEYQLQVMEKGERTASEIAANICVYKNVDKIAIEDAQKITRININLANMISNGLTDVKHNDQVKTIILLFLKELKSTGQLCGSAFIPFVRSLMSIKRTSKQIYFKQQIAELTIVLMKDIKYKDKYSELSSQTQFLIQLYLAFYISMSARHIICGVKK